MSSLFKQQTFFFARRLRHFLPGLVLAQIPEALLILLNKGFEVYLDQSPKLSFLILYPLYCLTSSLSSAMSLQVVTSLPSMSAVQSLQLKRILPRLPGLLWTSLIFGLVMIPATLALVVPGIIVLSRYLFLPFLVIDSPNKKLGWYFSQSQKISSKNRIFCLATAALSFVLSLLSLLGVSLIEGWLPVSEASGLWFELLFGLIASVFLNAWVANLYVEISKP